RFLLILSHNKTAVQVKEDMKNMVQIPILRQRLFKHTKLFGVSLFELQQKGLVEDGVPLVMRRMVEHLRKHALHQEGLFRVNGNVRAVETLKQRLESGEHVDLLSEADLCTVASLLKKYLRDLPEGLVDSTVQQALIHHYQECGDDVSWSDMRDLLQQLPDVHYSLLRYLCHFLTLVECNHQENRMTALNLATVFGPSVFHVAPGFEAMKDQNICNKIMAKLIQSYSSIFQSDGDGEGCTAEQATLIIVKIKSNFPCSVSDFALIFFLLSLSFLDRTIRSAVEQHLFDVDGQSSPPTSPSVTPTARQRRRHQREQQEEGPRNKERNSCWYQHAVSRLSVCPSEPVPAYSLQRESMDREEARLSPHAGGRLIRQLMEEDSDPMLSPRFYAYGQCQQYLDDTEVPPSPPNAHSFVSRRRSSSLGSCDDEKEELTSAQLTKRIHILKKKIHRFEERFEEERKYRPSHSDKAANPEVLRWVTELAKLRKELKEHKLMKSEEDLPPLTRQRSNTLPKSFGSQLEKKPQQEKVPKPPVETTLETILKKLQEKREEVNRPEDIKDMTREQIGAEKVALQKALLHYESIHGRPVTKSERQIMKPLYDRYRLVKQILCRASTIPVIGSPSSKRRGPLLQPIIEGETALFFDDIKEEEDGSEDDGDSKTQFTVSVQPEISVIGFLEHMDEEADGFISPVDELSPSKNTTDMRLSNLHSATTQELVEQLQEAREEKKRLRKNLKEFEDQFLRQNGRNVQKEDRSPLAVEYNEYKHVKAKLRLLEVLISKRDSSKLI
uniref:Family with sequence similarity 13 member A n=1 Tax=Sparus aurata TaxID=8175 RepID=A0A671W0D2_SPAAU